MLGGGSGGARHLGLWLVRGFSPGRPPVGLDSVRKEVVRTAPEGGINRHPLKTLG
jgi:hypothetical protein